MIKANIERINERIRLACVKSGRNPKDTVLVCVTKERSSLEILEAIRYGISHIGENKVKEALEKFNAIKSIAGVRFHMIGHLQTNKVKQALRLFDIIHSVDSLHLAQAISVEAKKLDKTADILIQVNTSGEPTKYGVKPEEAKKLIEETSFLNNIRIRGLMTMAPLVDKSEHARPCFRKLRLLRDGLAREFDDCDNIRMDYLSMGMSQDFEVANEEGANMIRIGRLIFEN